LLKKEVKNMMFEYSPEYKVEPISTKFNDDEFYYIGYINQNGKVDILEIMIGELYSESSPYSHSKRYYVKVLIPQEYYKSFFHKWMDLTHTKYYLNDTKIDIAFIHLAEKTQWLKTIGMNQQLFDILH